MKYLYIPLIIFLFLENNIYSQEAIITALPAFNIAPDARSTSMGSTGVASSSDLFSSYWNAAKYTYIEDDISTSFSFTPKLGQISNLSYLTGCYKITKSSAIAMSFRYYNYDQMLFADMEGGILGNYTPKDFSFDVSYSKKLSKYYSMSVTVRYIHSSLSNGQESDGFSSLNGNAFSTDIGAFWSNPDIYFLGKPAIFNWGINISNIGTKMVYQGLENNQFLPTNFRFGISLNQKIDQKNSLNFNLDANKLLVPTTTANNIGILEGMWSGLTYAPGGISEKFQEIIWNVGFEYIFNEIFALRTGYYFDHPNKGNNQVISFGAGTTMNEFTLDFSYSMPVGHYSNTGNILKFSLIYKTNFSYRRPSFYKNKY